MEELELEKERVRQCLLQESAKVSRLENDILELTEKLSSVREATETKQQEQQANLAEQQNASETPKQELEMHGFEHITISDPLVASEPEPQPAYSVHTAYSETL